MPTRLWAKRPQKRKSERKSPLHPEPGRVSRGE
jgi:hypothetical protein